MKTCSLVKYSAGVVALFCIILLALHTANVIVFTSSDQLHNGSFVNSANVTIPPKREDDLVTQKTILLWNGDWSDLSAFGTGHDAFMKAKCAVSDCKIVTNSTEFWQNVVDSNFQLLETFDTLIVNAHQLWKSSNRLPKIQRNPHQRIIYFTRESASYTFMPPEELPDGYFNWTMTYKRDADIWFPYGHVTASKSFRPLAELKSQWLNALRMKSKKVLWIASKCQTMSRREAYVDQLRQYIDVDIYGQCGNSTSDYTNLIHQYKFFLSFENSLCNDYVTESFFRALQNTLIPVVMGGANYSSLAPPHSYIDATQWTPQELALHLNQLDADDEAYLRYFDWKVNYTVETGVGPMARRALCHLCAKLHSPNPPKFYPTLVDEMGSQSQCHHQNIPWYHSKPEK